MVSEQKSDQEKYKELKRIKRQLEDQLELARAEVQSLKEANEDCRENCGIMEQIIKELYGEKVHVDFDQFKLCLDGKCVQFDTYRELLIALKIIKLFL